MWELDHKESWALKNWCFWTVLLEKTLESPLDSKEIQPVHPKRNESWIFTGRTDAEAETPILWPPDAKNWLIWKDPDARKRLKLGGEGDDREWDGWMASLTQWIWVWASSRSWWWTGKPGVLQSMGSHDWATELNWTSSQQYTLLPWHSVCVCVTCATFYFFFFHLLFLRVKRWTDNFRQCDTIFRSVEELEDTALPENLEWLFLRGHEEWFLEGGSPSALGTDEPRKETSCYKNTARQCDEHFYLQI